MNRNLVGTAKWEDSTYICALGDDERHIGHVVKLSKWLAYDATRLNDTADGFGFLGAFDHVGDAKREVERSAMQAPRWKTLSAIAAGSTVWGT